MTSAEVRVSGVSDRKEAIREKLAWSVIEQGDIIIRSPLDPSEPLNEHLVWLWTSLQHQRRFLKSIQECGGKLVCRCKVPKGKVRLLPNAAQMIHLLEMELVLEVK
ncbi:MAG TPA: hypothetical protein VF656_17085 [Pyrinomonadaceae bacterium]|jgi:hypothetical protein